MPWLHGLKASHEQEEVFNTKNSIQESYWKLKKNMPSNKTPIYVTK